MVKATSDLTSFSGCIVSSRRRVRTQSQRIARRSKYHSCLGLKDGRVPGVHVDSGRIYLADRCAVCRALPLASPRGLTPFLCRSGNAPGSLPPGPTPEQLARLRALVTSMGASAGPNPGPLFHLSTSLTSTHHVPRYQMTRSP